MPHQSLWLAAKIRTACRPFGRGGRFFNLFQRCPMANITPFSFQDSPVRTVIIADAVHFVGKDICEILGYADSSSAMKQHCRAPVKHHPILDALGRAQETRVLAESDMMRLIVNSKMPAAERFEAWVFEEVLPTIRKTGSYTAPSAVPPAPTFIPPSLASPPRSRSSARTGRWCGRRRTGPCRRR